MTTCMVKETFVKVPSTNQDKLVILRAKKNIQLNLKVTFSVWMRWSDLGICVEQHYLGILDLERAATGVDICSIERCLGTLCTLHRVKCK